MGAAQVVWAMGGTIGEGTMKCVFPFTHGGATCAPVLSAATAVASLVCSAPLPKAERILKEQPSPRELMQVPWMRQRRCAAQGGLLVVLLPVTLFPEIRNADRTSYLAIVHLDSAVRIGLQGPSC